MSSNLITPRSVETALPHKRGRRLKGADRREEILDAASTLFITYGPSKTTTRQIADAAGISQPSLYAHFKTKEALSHALATRAFALLERRMDMVVSLNEGPHAHLTNLIKGYIAFALEESAAYKIAFMVDLALADDHVHRLQKLVGLQAFAIFRDKIAILQSQNFIKSGSTDIMAQSIWAAMHGLCALLLARPLFPWASQEDLIASHTELIIRGARG